MLVIDEGYVDIDSNLSYGGLPLEDTYAMIKPVSAQVSYDQIMSVVHGHGFEVVSELQTKLSMTLANQFYCEHLGISPI